MNNYHGYQDPTIADWDRFSLMNDLVITFNRKPKNRGVVFITVKKELWR